MDKLRAMRTFVAIADAGSLTAAARAQDISLPAVVRLLAGLEDELGTRLFHRTTRRIALTDAGRHYLERCREVEVLIGEAEAELHAEQTEPQGRLSVTAPVLFGTRHVTNGVTAFVRSYPALSVEVLLLDRVVDLVEEGIDVGVRIGELEDSSLIARSVGTMRRVTVAAPKYLAERGVPEHPKQLSGHNCIRFMRTRSSVWTFTEGGKPLHVPVTGNLDVNQTLAAVGACVDGLGIGSFFEYQVAAEVESGVLRVLLAEFETRPRPIHVIYPEARLLPVRTRVFIDFIMRHIQSEARAWQLQVPKQRADRARPRQKPRRASK